MPKRPSYSLLLAYETHQHRAGNLPSATGARKPVILGKISQLDAERIPRECVYYDGTR